MSNRHGMKFNSKMWKVIHLGTNANNFFNKLGAYQLETTDEKKNFDVLIKMTESHQCDATLKKANVTLRCIK